MKKIYINPIVRHISLENSCLLCGSKDNINTGKSYYSGNNDYIGGSPTEGGDIWGHSNIPD